MKVRTVGGASTAEVVPLHNALKALPFGSAQHVDKINAFKNRGSQRIPGFGFIRRINADFTQFTHRSDTGLLKMARQRLNNPFRLLRTKPELDGFIAIRSGCFALNHTARSCLDNRYRYQLSFFVEDLGHTQFFS
jgi:hypothetical protein